MSHAGGFHLLVTVCSLWAVPAGIAHQVPAPVSSAPWCVWCCDVRAATRRVLSQAPLSPQLSPDAEEQVGGIRTSAVFFFCVRARSRSMHKGGSARSRPLCRSNSWFGERVSRECELLTVGAQPDSCSVTRGSDGDCVGGAEQGRLGGHYGTGTDRRERESSAQGRASTASTRTVFMEISRVEGERKHLAWRSREARRLGLHGRVLLCLDWEELTTN